MTELNTIAFDSKVDNPTWEKVGTDALPDICNPTIGSIEQVYEIEPNQSYGILLRQTWVPYDWYFKNSAWELTHVATAPYGGFKLPFIGHLGVKTGLIAIISNTDRDND